MDSYEHSQDVSLGDINIRIRYEVDQIILEFDAQEFRFWDQLPAIYCTVCNLYIYPQLKSSIRPLYHHIYYHHHPAVAQHKIIQEFGAVVLDRQRELFPEGIQPYGIRFLQLDTLLLVKDGFKCTLCALIGSFVVMQSHFKASHPTSKIDSHITYCCMKSPYGKLKPSIEVPILEVSEDIPSIPLSAGESVITDPIYLLQYCQSCSIYIPPPGKSRFTPLYSHVYRQHREVCTDTLLVNVDTVDMMTRRKRHHASLEDPFKQRYLEDCLVSREAGYLCKLEGCGGILAKGTLGYHYRTYHKGCEGKVVEKVGIRKIFGGKHPPVLSS